MFIRLATGHELGDTIVQVIFNTGPTLPMSTPKPIDIFNDSRISKSAVEAIIEAIKRPRPMFTKPDPGMKDASVQDLIESSLKKANQKLKHSKRKGSFTYFRFKWQAPDFRQQCSDQVAGCI